MPQYPGRFPYMNNPMGLMPQKKKRKLSSPKNLLIIFTIIFIGLVVYAAFYISQGMGSSSGEKCDKDSDCKNQICENGVCIGVECEKNKVLESNCPDGSTITEWVCVNNRRDWTNKECPIVNCTQDDECLGEFICENGFCIEENPVINNPSENNQTPASNVEEYKCQNAGGGELCGGLDLVYGEGYMSKCCSEFNLCC